MKIGVYVGSFNPVHIGHIRIVKHLIKKKYVDKVIIIPTGNYWDKNDLIDIKHRINMLKKYESEEITVNSTLTHLKYTYQILDELTNNSKDEFFLIIGADNLINFDKWKNVNYLKTFKLIIINRDNINIKEYTKKYDINNYTIINDLTLLEISATNIRNLLNQKKYKEADKYIDKEILEYILNNKLYLE